MKNFRLLFFLVFLVSVVFCESQQHIIATYYSHKLKGRHTSDGGRYHPDSMTCAHRTYPFGTYLKVRNPKNDREVIVKVTDRGPFQKKLSIDLSYSAAKILDIFRLGIAPVIITQIDYLPPFIPLYISIQVTELTISPRTMDNGAHRLFISGSNPR